MRTTPLCNKIEKKCMRWSISLRPVQHITTLSCISQKNDISLQLTIVLYYLPIVLSITTKHNFIPFYVYGHQTGKCCKILHVVRDIPVRNRPEIWMNISIRYKIHLLVIYLVISTLCFYPKFCYFNTVFSLLFHKKSIIPQFMCIDILSIHFWYAIALYITNLLILTDNIDDL